MEQLLLAVIAISLLIALLFLTAILEVKIIKRNKQAKVVRTKGWSLDE